MCVYVFNWRKYQHIEWIVGRLYFTTNFLETVQKINIKLNFSSTFWVVICVKQYNCMFWATSSWEFYIKIVSQMWTTRKKTVTSETKNTLHTDCTLIYHSFIKWTLISWTLVKFEHIFNNKPNKSFFTVYIIFMDTTHPQIKRVFIHVTHDCKKDVPYYMKTVYLIETTAATYSSFGNIFVLKLNFIVIRNC